MDRSVRIYKALIWLTLYGATLHIVDNVYLYEQYPEPAWLGPVVIAVLWIPIALLAHRAVDYVYQGKVEQSYSLVHGFVLANWITLGHYLFGNPVTILPRINLAIAAQIGPATVLFLYTLWLQFSRSPDSLRRTRREWLRNVAIFAAIIVVLEFFWPSTYSSWWMFWRA